MSKIEHKKSSLFLCRKHTVVWKDAPHFHGGRERWEWTPSHQMLLISIYWRKTILTRSVTSAILLSKWREKETRFVSFSLSICWIAWYFCVSTCLWWCIGELILLFSHSLHHLEGNSTTRGRATHKGLLFFLFLCFVCDLQSTFCNYLSKVLSKTILQFSLLKHNWLFWWSSNFLFLCLLLFNL